MKTLICLSVLCLSACASTQSGFDPKNGSTYNARANDFVITVFEGEALPKVPYEVIAEVEAHFEATFFKSYTMKDAIKELKSQAREAGANAIADIKEERSRYLENSIYHVTAKALRYTN